MPWTAEQFKPQLKFFLKRVRTNLKNRGNTTGQVVNAQKGTKKRKEKNNKNEIKKRRPPNPSRPLPKIEGVADSIIRKSVKNEEKRKQRSMRKKEVTRTGPPKRASWNQERLVIGVYAPKSLHSETEKDPIHRK